jgi:hypothetical protein
MQVITVYVSRDLRKLKTSALRLWDVTFNHRLRPSRYKWKTLFSPETVGRIAAYSKGLARLVNTICDNPLPIAYSAFKTQAVSAEMVEKEKLAQGFQLHVETSTETDMARANSRTLENRHETEAEAQRVQFGDRVVGLEDETPEIYFKHGPTKSAIAIFAGIILLVCFAAVSYLQQSKNYLTHLAVTWGAIGQQGLRNTSNIQVTVEGSKTQPVAPQLSSTNHEPAQPDGRESTAKRARDHLGNFEVVDDSFVRDKPQPNATIIATLRPGTQVTVENKTGEYLRIRSFNGAEVIGYVHEEDAFFQAH